MDQLTYTLAADGPTDRALLPILDWLLERHGVSGAIQAQMIDHSVLPKQPRESKLPALAWRIQQSLMLYPCDLLFIHRDAEREEREERLEEINQALAALSEESALPVVPVIPVRMTEAWLLIDEAAIREASGNPNGKVALILPRLRILESLPAPKEELRKLLRTASGLNDRRYREAPLHRVADCIANFAMLRQLPAFQTLEADIEQRIRTMGWNVWAQPVQESP